jgi:predicted secreted acid phosphatase
MDIIVDIDGTVADCSHRRHWVRHNPKNWPAFNMSMHLDTPIDHVINVVRELFRNGHTIIFCSGRSDEYRDVSMNWISKHVIDGCLLYMRPAKDNRPDDIIKSELLDRIIQDGYNPTMVFDDRKKVCDMWIARGLFLFDVSQGNGDF